MISTRDTLRVGNLMTLDPIVIAPDEPAAEAERRRPLGWPPFSAMAHVSGAPAADYVGAVPAGVQVLGPADGAYLLRAPDHRTLCDGLAATPRPPGRLRVAVDPLRV